MHYSPSKSKILKVKRNTAELKSKLHQMFQDNLVDFKRYANWYGGKYTLDECGKMRYEHDLIENYKKSVYGDDYEIQEFVYP